jgi:hypothetical protein
MDSEDIDHLNRRIYELEVKVDRLITMFERIDGGWTALKLVGATMVGAIAIWAFLTDHIKFH